LKTSGGQPVCIEGTKINWKELGKSLRHEFKKVTNKKTGETKTVQGAKIASFFDIFEDQNQ
jgi:hypothetical protein